MNLLTPKDVSVTLGICTDNTYKLIKQKCFPSVRIGRRFFVEEEDLKEFMKKYKYSEIYFK